MEGVQKGEIFELNSRSTDAQNGTRGIILSECNLCDTMVLNVLFSGCSWKDYTLTRKGIQCRAGCPSGKSETCFIELPFLLEVSKKGNVNLN